MYIYTLAIYCTAKIAKKSSKMLKLVFIAKYILGIDEM